MIDGTQINPSKISKKLLNFNMDYSINVLKLNISFEGDYLYMKNFNFNGDRIKGDLNALRIKQDIHKIENGIDYPLELRCLETGNFKYEFSFKIYGQDYKISGYKECFLKMSDPVKVN